MTTEKCDINGAAVPSIFISLRAGRKTGTAVFEFIQSQTARQVVKKVYCKEGDVIFASSNLEDDWLGRWLARAGRITQQQCDASEDLTRQTGKKQGAVLVELGFLTPHGLVDGVKLQVREIIQSLFSIPAGCYRFEEGALPAADIIPLQMSIGNLIVEGLRKLDWKAARKNVPSPNTVLSPSSDPSTLFQKIDLTADESAVLALIDGKRSIEELCVLSGIGDFNTLKAVHLLVSLKMIESGAVKSDAEISAAREAVSAAAAQAAAPVDDIATRETIITAFDVMQHQDHYEVLGVPRSAGEREVKKAYFHLAKRYHPDRHFEPDMADLKHKLEILFTRIHEAYDVLSNAERRKEYDSAAVKPAATQFQEHRPEDYVENYAEKSVRATAYYNAGMKDFKVGNYWGAAEALTWATRLDPVKASYFYQLGITLSHIPRRMHEAEERFQKAIEIDPLKAEYYLALGNLYMRSGMKSKALGVYHDALEHNPAADTIKEAIRAAGGEVPAESTESEKSGVFGKFFKKG